MPEEQHPFGEGEAPTTVLSPSQGACLLWRKCIPRKSLQPSLRRGL